MCMTAFKKNIPMHNMQLMCKHAYNNVKNELVEATIVCGW